MDTRLAAIMSLGAALCACPGDAPDPADVAVDGAMAVDSADGAVAADAADAAMAVDAADGTPGADSADGAPEADSADGTPEADSADAAAEPDSVPPVADTAGQGDDTVGQGDTPDVTSGDPLSACDGAALIHVASGAGEERELVPWTGGDTSIRGYLASCDATARFRIRARCGGPLTATLTWANAETELGLALRADEVDAGTVATGAHTASVPLARHADADASGDYQLDLDVSCASGGPTTWSLLLDTTSTQPVPAAANGWSRDLLPADYAGCGEGRFPAFEPLVDQYGNDDVTLGQFYGDVTVVAYTSLEGGSADSFATYSAELHQRLEALSPDWGVSLIQVVPVDEDGHPAYAIDVADLASRRPVSTPLVAGEHAGDQPSCATHGSLPTVFILDPASKIRAKIGVTWHDTIAAEVEAAMLSFRNEQPDWVSPRCAGVTGADVLCPCADPDPDAADGDADGVPDACDACADAHDRLDFDRDGVPNACDETPGEQRAPNYGTVAQVKVEFQGYRDASGALAILTKHIWGHPVVYPTAVSFSLASPTMRPLCDLHADLVTDGAVVPVPDAGDDVVVSWRLRFQTPDHDCQGTLDPAVWGPDVTATFLDLPLGITFDARCAGDGCAGQDDPAFAPDGAGSWYCAPATDSCREELLGVSLWRSGVGLIRGPAGESLGVGVVRSAGERVPALEVIASPPAGRYHGTFVLEGPQIGSLFTAGP